MMLKTNIINCLKFLLFLGFCYAMFNSILNLLSRETSITNYRDKINVNEKIPMPAFTILPFDSNAYFNISKFEKIMGNGKKFPSWFKPMAPFDIYANEEKLKSELNLTWYDIWSINAVPTNIYIPGRELSFYQAITFNPPTKLLNYNSGRFDNRYIKFEVKKDIFRGYLVDIHEPQNSLWWDRGFNWGGVEIFDLLQNSR